MNTLLQRSTALAAIVLLAALAVTVVADPVPKAKANKVHPPVPDWTGQYESGTSAGGNTTHIVVVAKTADGYECQWYSADGSQLVWLGELARNADGFWIESYPSDRSPSGSPPYWWKHPRSVRRRPWPVTWTT